jgi:hypothetical protein
MVDPCLGCTPVTVLRDLPAQLGVSRRAVGRLLAEGELVRVDRYLVVGRCVVERAAVDPAAAHRLNLDRLLATYPESSATHESAVLVHGLPLADIPFTATVARTWGAWRGGDYGRVRITTLPEHHLLLVGGVPVTTVPRTIVDLARGTSAGNAVVAGDAALRRGMTPQELHAVLRESAAWADVGNASKLLAFLDGRSESPLESLSRLVMHEYGVPQPEIQVTLYTRRASYRVDFYWRAQRLIGEADGRQKYDSPDKVWAEKQREDDLREDHQVVRWTYRDLRGDPEGTMHRIMRRLEG